MSDNYTENQSNDIMSQEELEEAARRKAYRRQVRREKEKRKRRNLIAALCIAWSLVFIEACAIIVLVRFKVSQPAVSTGGEVRTVADTDEDGQTGDEPMTSNKNEKPANEFASLYYYEADKLDRYQAYKEKNPDMSADEVVWRVNAWLDKPWYENDVAVSGYDDPYIIVNKYYTVPDDYRPNDLVTVDDQLVRKDTADAFREMQREASKLGMHIQAVSGYRSVEYQRNLYNRYLSSDSRESVDRYSARPGHSEHHTGMAIDLFGTGCTKLRDFVNSPEGPWVREHCNEYGFIIRYTEPTEGITGYEDEPWHIRYVGKEVSMDMKEKGITTFEEYHVKYIEHSPDE